EITPRRRLPADDAQELRVAAARLPDREPRHVGLEALERGAVPLQEALKGHRAAARPHPIAGQDARDQLAAVRRQRREPDPHLRVLAARGKVLVERPRELEARLAHDGRAAVADVVAPDEMARGRSPAAGNEELSRALAGFR